MVKKKEDIPDWVSDEIQNAKFQKPKEMRRSGYILELYEEDNKIDVQLYDAVEDGRHIVTMDLTESVKIEGLEKGLVYEFVFKQYKAPLSKKVSEFLEKEKEIMMNAIYQFELVSLESLDVETDMDTSDDDNDGDDVAKEE